MWLDFPAVFYPALTAPDPYATYGYFNPPHVDFSPFPYALPLGLGLFLMARLRRDHYLAALSTIFVTPYIGANSLLVYSAVITSRHGRVVAIAWTAAMRILAFNRFS